MSTLLINGCSYLRSWNSCHELGNNIGLENTVNLSVSGSSNDRIFRSTLEYIFANSVDFVVLSLTFWDRSEAPWCEYRPYENHWASYSVNGIPHNVHPYLKMQPKLYQSYIQDRYRYDIVNEHYMDKFLNDVITFTGWLDNQHIRYLIFSAVGKEYFKFDTIPNINFKKLDYIRNNKRLLDIENWSSNQFMFDNGGDSEEDHVIPPYRHYSPKSFYALNDFLHDYIIKNQL